MTGGSEGEEEGGTEVGREVRAAALFGSKSTDVQCARCSSGRKERGRAGTGSSRGESGFFGPLLNFFLCGKTSIQP